MRAPPPSPPRSRQSPRPGCRIPAPAAAAPLRPSAASPDRASCAPCRPARAAPARPPGRRNAARGTDSAPGARPAAGPAHPPAACGDETARLHPLQHIGLARFRPSPDVGRAAGATATAAGPRAGRPRPGSVRPGSWRNSAAPPPRSPRGSRRTAPGPGSAPESPACRTAAPIAARERPPPPWSPACAAAAAPSGSPAS